MRVVIQLAKLLKHDLHGRGLIREMADYTGLERHSISALLRNRSAYVSLDSIGRLCDYLVHRRGVNPAILPGALFGAERDGFWEMLAGRTQVSFCLATRTHPQWPDTEYVMANDSHLQGVLAAQVSALDAPRARELDGGAPGSRVEGDAERVASGEEMAPGELDVKQVERPTLTGGNVKRVFFDPHVLPAPRREPGRGRNQWKTLTEGKQRAAEIYSEFQRQGESNVLFTLGSVKVNGVLEMLVADVFKGTPFQSEDNVSSPTQRSCPFFFRYRSHDPAPKSLCGGTRLSKRKAPRTPGIYYETEKGTWECCPCKPNEQDVAFVLYAYRPPVDELHLACGGFSGLATRFLAERFMSVASQFWPPQFESAELHVGLFLVAFGIRRSANGRGRNVASQFKHRVIRLHEDVIQRRLGKPEME